MARPYWSGTIQISLVSFGVRFFVATEYKSEIRFHQISRSTGERVRQQKVLQSAVDNGALEEGAEAASVGKDDIVKGYEYAKGQYVTFEPSEIANLRVPSKHSIAVEQFVAESEIDPAYFEKPYFVTPDGDAQAEAFAVVRKAMHASRKMAIGKIAFGGREHIVAIKANDDEEHPGLMAYTMRYQQELRNPMEYFGGLRAMDVDEDQLDLAEQLIKKKTGKFDASKYKDGYEVALRELVDAKVNNEPLPQEQPAPRRAKVVNLMDALRDSLRGSGGATQDDATAPKKASRSEKKPDAAAKTAEAKDDSRNAKVLNMPAKKTAAKPAARSRSAHAKSA